MPASEDLLTAFKAFYSGTIRPDLVDIVTSSEGRILGQLRGEMAETAEGLRGEIRGTTEGLRGTLREEIRGTAEDLRGEIRGTAESLRGELRDEIRETAEGLRGEIRETEGRLRFEIREGDGRVGETLRASVDELRRDMNGHFDAVHKRLGHLETEYRMLVVGLRRLEDAQSPGGSG